VTLRPHRRLLAGREATAVVVIACCALLGQTTGCGGRGRGAKERNSSAQAAGASTDHYLPASSAQPGARGGLGPLARPLPPPAPKPTGFLPLGTSCVTPECHGAYAVAPHIHGPVAKRSCESCHADDVGGHKYPVFRDPIGMCSFCHVVAGTKSHQHKPVTQSCTSCHNPHVSDAKFLLKAEPIDRSCAACHRVPWKRYTHSALASGDCSLCHQAHQSDNRMLLIGGTGPEHCFLCHEGVREAIAASPYVHKPLREQCTGCHDPHATDFEHQLKAPLDQSCLSCHKKLRERMQKVAYHHGAVTTGRTCANCHTGHASSHASLLPQRMDEVCLRCHDRPITTEDGRVIADMRPELKESKYRHGPVRSGQCSACHDAHGEDRRMLLRRPFAETFYAPFDVGNFALCFGCHSSEMVLLDKTVELTSFRNGQDNLHYRHVYRDRKGRTCRTCHEIHGSNLPKHMASEVPFEGSDWPLPIRFEKTQTGGRCSPGCHNPAAYDRNRPVTRPIAEDVK